MHLSKDEQILYNHFEDMYNTAYNRGIPIFSDFVGLNGLELCYRLLDKNKVRPDMYENKLITYGGYDGCYVFYLKTIRLILEKLISQYPV